MKISVSGLYNVKTSINGLCDAETSISGLYDVETSISGLYQVETNHNNKLELCDDRDIISRVISPYIIIQLPDVDLKLGSPIDVSLTAVT